MKTLFLVRHAKSSWDFDLSDHDRPLNPRGHHDAQAMAKLMVAHKAESIISSTAQRAITTAEYFAYEQGFDKDKIITSSNLYLCNTKELESIVQNIDNQLNTIFIFGHNPGISEYASLFLDKHNNILDADMPTCTVIRLASVTDDWANFSFPKAKLTGRWCPKKDLEPYKEG